MPNPDWSQAQSDIGDEIAERETQATMPVTTPNNPKREKENNRHGISQRIA